MYEIAHLKGIKPNQVIWRLDIQTKKVSIAPFKSIELNKVKSKDYVFEHGYLYTLAVTRKKAIKNFNEKKIINSKFIEQHVNNTTH